MKGDSSSGQVDGHLSVLFSLSCALFLLLIPSFVYAGDAPFTSPTNRGDTGLIEIPSARVLGESTYRLGGGQAYPYRYYYGAVSPYRGLEIGGRITEVIGVEAFEELGSFGNTRDKAADIKFQFLRERIYLPALAFGFMDPSGTRLYSSQYFVASKQIYPFDVTLGIGNGWFGKGPLPSTGEGFGLEIFEDPRGWLDDALLFWGVQFAPSEKYNIAIEYSPVNYHLQTSDPAQARYFTTPVSTHYNVAFRYRPTKWSEIALTWQRGNQIGVNVSFVFNIGKPLIPLYDPPYREEETERVRPFTERLTKALFASGFTDVVVEERGGALRIEAQNEKYFYQSRAITVIMEVVDSMAPSRTGEVRIVLKERGIPSFEFTTTRDDIRELAAERLTAGELSTLSTVGREIRQTSPLKGTGKRRLRYGLKPSFETFLNDPSGFFKYRLGLAGWLSYEPWRGATFVSAVEGYPLNTVSTSNEPLSIPVRSDIALYKSEKIVVGRLMYDQVVKMRREVYGRFAAGLLEVQYAGIEGEIAKPFLNGLVVVGIEGSLVKKRAPDSPFTMQEKPVKDFFSTVFLNTRVNAKRHDISVDLKSGMFLAGDWGTRITVSKRIRGVVLSAWYSFTDTSLFDDDFNRGYHDKGIAVVIPLRIFKGSDTRSAYTYSLAPWTRDVAQDLDSYTDLFDFINKNGIIDFDNGK